MTSDLYTNYVQSRDLLVTKIVDDLKEKLTEDNTLHSHYKRWLVDPKMQKLNSKIQRGVRLDDLYKCNYTYYCNINESRTNALFNELLGVSNDVKDYCTCSLRYKSELECVLQDIGIEIQTAKNESSNFWLIHEFEIKPESAKWDWKNGGLWEDIVTTMAHKYDGLCVEKTFSEYIVVEKCDYGYGSDSD